MSKNTGLTTKESFINAMIKESVEIGEGFDPGLISSTQFTFDELTNFILIKDLEEEFKEYVKDVNDIGKYVHATIMLNKVFKKKK